MKNNCPNFTATLTGSALLLLALSCLLYTVYRSHNIEIAPRLYQTHQQVLAGTARAPVQYQLYVHDQIIEWIFACAPKRTPIWFAAAYMLYYVAGLLLFLAFLYRLCLRCGSQVSALLAMLYLVAVYNMFWFDNDYHPNDPWGALLAVGLVSELLNGQRSWRYYALLLLSGFVWEKHVLVPFSVAAMEFWRCRRHLLRIGGELTVALALASIGQVLPRLIYGADRAWFGPPPGYNLTQMHVYAWAMAVVFGLPLAYLALRARETPLVLRMLALQFPVWAIIYLWSPGVLREMRGILIMVPFTWPLMVRALDTWVLAPGDVANATRSGRRAEDIQVIQGERAKHTATR